MNPSGRRSVSAATHRRPSSWTDWPVTAAPKPAVASAFGNSARGLMRARMVRLLTSSRHRVLPLQAEAPDEDLVSLVYFYEADHETGSRTVLGTGPYKIAA